MGAAIGVLATIVGTLTAAATLGVKIAHHGKAHIVNHGNGTDPSHGHGNFFASMFKGDGNGTAIGYPNGTVVVYPHGVAAGGGQVHNMVNATWLGHWLESHGIKVNITMNREKGWSVIFHNSNSTTNHTFHPFHSHNNTKNLVNTTTSTLFSTLNDPFYNEYTTKTNNKGFEPWQIGLLVAGVVVVVVGVGMGVGVEVIKRRRAREVAALEAKKEVEMEEAA